MDLRLLLLDRRPRAVMGTGAGRRQGGDRGGSGGKWGAAPCQLALGNLEGRGQKGRMQEAAQLQDREEHFAVD